MSESQVLQEFLVAIRYEERGREKLLSDLVEVGKNLTKFAAAIEAAAAAAVLAVAKIAAGFEDLYFASQRIGASVENIRALSFAVAQMGGSADGARQALEGLGRFLRSNPGSESFLQSLGISTRDAAGQLRDTSAMMEDLGERWRRMPFFQAQAQASIFGIDERTLMALMQGTREFSDQLHAMYRAAGVDSEQAAKQSHSFMVELRLLLLAFGVLRDRVMTDLAGKMTGGIARFRASLVANFGDVSKAITWLTEKLLVAADFVTQFVVRGVDAAAQLIRWWNGLSEASKQLGEVIAGLFAGIALLASPAAGIAALAAAIFMLWEDYDTWRKGGTSLIDWDKWEPSIKAAKEAIIGVADTIRKELGPAFSDFMDKLGPRLEYFFKEVFPKALSATVKAIVDMSKMLGAVMRMLAAVSTGDFHGALAAAADFNNALGITSPEGPAQTPSASAADEAVRRNGQQNWWQRHAPRWLNGARPNPAWMGGGSSTGATGGTSQLTGSADKAAFIAKWRPEAERIAARVGTSADNILAHWGQETAWGASEHDNNVGNLQALRAGPGTVTRGDTHADGSAYQAPFFAYSSPAEAADAYASWVERHNAVGPGANDDALAFGNRLRGAHYMENPNAAADIARARASLGGRPTAVASRGGPSGTPAPGTFNPSPILDVPRAPAAASNTTTTNSPAFNQTVNVTINGGSGDVAGQVQSGLRNSNQNAIRNLATAIS